MYPASFLGAAQFFQTAIFSFEINYHRPCINCIGEYLMPFLKARAKVNGYVKSKNGNDDKVNSKIFIWFVAFLFV